MKRLTIFVLGVVFVTSAHAGWWKTFGGPTNDYGYCVQITSDSNYIISGYKEGSGLWLIKTDTSGTPLWSTTYGEEIRGGKWVEETSDGDYVVACWTPSLVKIGTQGDTMWTRDLGMYSYCVQETFDSGYIVLGGDNGAGGDTYFKLVKTNSDGDSLWSQTCTEPGHDFNSGFFIQETSDRGYIITGKTDYVEGEEGEFVTEYLWLVKTDVNGDIQWTRKYGTGENYEFNIGRCVRQLSDGGYIITGRRGFGGSGLWILRADENGDTLWTRTYGNGQGEHIQRTSDDGYIITGGTETGYVCSTPQLSDLWLIKTDSLGDSTWSRIYGGSKGDAGCCVQQTNDTGYIVVGETWSYGAGKQDIYLLRTDSLGLLGITERSFPEPTSNWQVLTGIGAVIVLSYSDRPQGFNAVIFDVAGRRVAALRNPNLSGTISWGEDQPRGVYFIKVNENIDKTTTAKVVLTR